MECLLEWRLEPSNETKYDMSTDLVSQIQEFLNNEARSCSMDYGCVTPLYVYRMFGGTITLEDIEMALPNCKKELGL